MSDTEALMWQIERDPVLRSSFSTVTFLDGQPDVDRFRQRMTGALVAIPRLRQRVVPPPAGLGVPTWADDPEFDLDYHIRRAALPAPAGDRELLDLAAVLQQDPFDPVRPLWQFTLVEGLSGDRTALIVKMHHTISDGVGAVRLSTQFIDIERDPPPPAASGPRDVGTDGNGPSLVEAAGDALRRPIGLGLKALSGMAGAMTRPVETTGSAWSAIRQLIVTDPARSPLWAGKRGAARRFEIVSTDLEAAKGAAKALGGTVNDLYVTALAGAAGAYHRAKGSEVDELRVSVPISTRADKSAGGNSFVPTRLLVPAGELDPAERFRLVHERMTSVKQDRTLGMGDGLAAVAAGLPGSVLTKLARSQVQTVDFAASNLRGAPFDLFVAGAEVLANHPFGPTGGTAFNATVLSYRGSMDIGLNIDTAAVDDGPLLRTLVEQAFQELTAVNL